MAMSEAYKLKKQIRSEIKKMYDDAMVDIVDDVSRKIAKLYESTIDYFYEDKVFTHKYGYGKTNVPRSYKRKHNLYKMDEYIREENVAGIDLSKHLGEKMYRAASTKYVYDNAFFEGIHGFSYSNKDGAYKNMIENSMFSFHRGVNVPSVTRPSPHTKMNSYFRNFIKSGDIDKIVKNTFDKYIYNRRS